MVGLRPELTEMPLALGQEKWLTMSLPWSSAIMKETRQKVRSPDFK